MAAKAWASQPKARDEVFFQNDAVSLRLLINRRARTMRVIDFRAGATTAKRLYVQSLAQREGVEKVYTLVERDEVQTWIKLGFAKEGNIPGFYKRSDAFVLGRAVPLPSPSKATNGKVDGGVRLESETRLVVAATVGGAPPLGASPAQDRMERTLVLGKRGLKDLGEKLLAAKIAPIDESEARKAVLAALRSGRALTEFEPFGRDVLRRYFMATVRGGFELALSTESQHCFSNAFLELLSSPRNDAEKHGTAAAVHSICDKLTAEGIVSCFSLAPSDDVALATVFLHCGFRRTGLLLDHLVVGTTRRDAILWSRKLSNPADD